ncbi:ferredoxin [Desulfobulbus propionicus]|jgi:ferredoxin
MSKQVTINQEECIGCESCVEICPEVFGFDIDETKAYVIMDEDGEHDEECIEEAMAACPAGCISYE